MSALAFVHGGAALAASVRAVRTHYGSQRIGILETRAEVLNCARKAAKGSECDFALALRSSLEVATQLDITELAQLAETSWPRLRGCP
jgi:hypothetical protein